MRRSDAESGPIALFGQLSAVALLSFFLGGSSSAESSPIYNIVNLGSLGSGPAMVSGINSAGVAVGFVTNTQGNLTPVSLSGQTTALTGYGQANGINSVGTIVGTALSNGSPTVTTWSNGQATSLNVSGYGTSINTSGEVAGGYLTPSGELRAFTWANGSLVDIGTLGGNWSSAYAINDSGAVAGTSTTSSGRFAAFFSGGQGLVNLGTLGGANSYGLGINASGTVVGNSQTAQGYLNSFEWSGGQMVDLGTLGGSQSFAYGVNNAGAAVGYSYTAENADIHGFLYSDGVMVDVNSLLPLASGWTINQAYAIDDTGDILGMGTLDGQSYAVDLLAPHASAGAAAVNSQPLATPEPAAFLLTGLGLALIGKLGRQYRRSKERSEEI